MILKGSFFLVLLIGVVICLPPFLALRLLVRSYHRAHRRQLPTGRYLAAIAVCIIAFLFNLGVLIGSANAIADGGVAFGPVQTLAAGIAWIAFWAWLFLSYALRHKSGLR